MLASWLILAGDVFFMHLVHHSFPLYSSREVFIFPSYRSERALVQSNRNYYSMCSSSVSLDLLARTQYEGLNKSKYIKNLFEWPQNLQLKSHAKKYT